MTVSELIKELRAIVIVHPEVKDFTVEARTLEGRMSGLVTVRLMTKTGRVILIEGMGYEQRG